MPERRPHADDSSQPNLRRSPAQGVAPAKPRISGTRGPVPPAQPVQPAQPPQPLQVAPPLHPPPPMYTPPPALPSVPKIDAPIPPSGLLPGVTEAPRRSPSHGVVPTRGTPVAGTAPVPRGGTPARGAPIPVRGTPRAGVGIPTTPVSVLKTNTPAKGVLPAPAAGPGKARPAGASRANLKPIALPQDPPLPDLPPMPRVPETPALSADSDWPPEAVPLPSAPLLPLPIPVKPRPGGGSKHNLKAIVDGSDLADSATAANAGPAAPEALPVKSKLAASRSNLKAISTEDERESASRHSRKKVKRGAVGGTDPAADKETAKLIKNIWRQAVNENTSPGQTIKSLKTAFANASPSEGAPSGSAQRFEDAFPQSDLVGYTIGDEIGRGGMGVVYKAYQQSLKRDVAIKLLLPEMAADPEHAAKFVAEALINAELSHPNIMPVYEIGKTSDGRKYMVMKLVIGISWWSILHPFTEAEKEVARKLELSDHLDLLLRTCDAVAYAHSRQIIHRDIKPDNVLVGQYGEVLLMDWGVAGDLRPNLPLSEYKAEPLHAINHPAGTPHYMAPEMARVHTEHIGRGTDIYLLGASLYEILTGRPPHQAKETMDILIEAAKNTVLEREEPTVNRELMRIAKHAMATLPGDRYPTVEAFAQAVREFRKHAESLAITESANASLNIARNSRGARAYQYYSEALGGFAQALQLWPANQEAVFGRFDAISQHTKLSLSSGDFALAESLINQWRAYARHLPPEQKKREDQDIIELSFQLNEGRRQIKARASTLAFAKFFSATLLAVMILGGGVAFFMIENAYQEAVAQRNKIDKERLSAQVEEKKARDAELLQARAMGEVRQKTAELETALAEARDERARALEENTNARESLAEAFASQADTRLQEKNFSAARLLYARSLQLINNEHARQGLIQVGRPRVRWIYQPPFGGDATAKETFACQFSPDGERLYLAMSGGATNLYCHDATDGKVIWSASKLAAAGAVCKALELSRDGAVLAMLFCDAGGQTGSLAVINARTGDVNHLFQLAHGFYFADISPDGTLLVGTNEDGVTLLRVQDGQPVWTSKEAGDHSAPCCFSSDGRQLIIARAGTALGVLDLDGHAVAGNWNYREQTGNLRAAALSPDGTRLLLAGREGDCSVYQFAPFHVLHFDTLHESETMTIAASPTNEFGASGSQAGEVLVWRQSNQRAVHRFKYSNQAIAGLAFAPDERTLAIAGTDGTLRVVSLDLEQPRRVQTNRATDEPARVRMCLSSDGATAFLADLTNGPGQVCIDAVSMESGGSRWSVRTPSTPVDPANPTAAASPDSRQIAALALSTDNKWVAAGDAGGQVRIFDAATGQCRARRTFADLGVTEICDVGFGATAEELLVLGAKGDDHNFRRIAVWNWNKDTLHPLEKQDFSDALQSVRWLPEQHRWLIGAFGVSFTLNADLAEMTPMTHWSSPIYQLSADAKQLAGVYEDKGLCLLNIDRMTSQLFLDQSGTKIESLSFSTDGKYLAGGSSDGNLMIWETSRGRLLCKITVGARNCQFISWLPDQLKVLVAGAGRAPLSLFDLSALDGTGDEHMRSAQIDLHRKVIGFRTVDITDFEYKRILDKKSAPADPNADNN